MNIHGVSYLLLSKFDGKFESVEVHAFAVLERWSRGIVVEEHLQLVRAPGVVQQGRGEVLALLPELLVLSLELVLHEAQSGIEDTYKG